MEVSIKDLGGSILDKEEFTKKGKTIYRKLQPKFKKDKGKIVAIEIESDDYSIPKHCWFPK